MPEKRTVERAQRAIAIGLLAQQAARTKGPVRRKIAARKAARTRAAKS